jgi:hypothetical protein
MAGFLAQDLRLWTPRRNSAHGFGDTEIPSNAARLSAEGSRSPLSNTLIKFSAIRLLKLAVSISLSGRFSDFPAVSNASDIAVESKRISSES